MCELYRLLDVKIAALTSYHPKSNGQTEHINQELEQYLHIFVNERQDDWDEWLLMVEFTYNNHIHTSTKHTPFFADTGCHPRMGFEQIERGLNVEAVNNFASRMKDTLSKAWAALAKSKDDMAHYYNQRCKPAHTFAVGDKVFLDSSNINTMQPSKKLLHHYLGPFAVVRPVGSHAYRLRLPPSMSWLHPVFHVIKLLPVPPDPIGCRDRPPPPPMVIGANEHYEVQAILDSHLQVECLEFLVSWKGYGYEENSWVSNHDMSAPRLISQFYRNHPGAPRRIRALNFGRMGFRSSPWHVGSSHP
jgi:hypothetical protein